MSQSDERNKARRENHSRLITVQCTINKRSDLPIQCLPAFDAPKHCSATTCPKRSERRLFTQNKRRQPTIVRLYIIETATRALGKREAKRPRVHILKWHVLQHGRGLMKAETIHTRDQTDRLLLQVFKQQAAEKRANNNNKNNPTVVAAVRCLFHTPDLYKKAVYKMVTMVPTRNLFR